MVLHASSCRECECSSTESVDQVKYLGSQFDEDLSWYNPHVVFMSRINELFTISVQYKCAYVILR